jgi:RNA polymerase sigma-70 factor (ECF subfamily)
MDTTALHHRLGELRPRLHRYCARMTGSVIDGEDVVQDTLAKAIAANDDSIEGAYLDRWVFRIAHNTALDLLRRRSRRLDVHGQEELDMLVEPSNPIVDHAITAASLGTFMHLSVVQRSCVILADVLGYSLREIGEVLDASVPAVKSALHRGRTRLHELADAPPEMPPELSSSERDRLASYVARFNARDFDALRDLLAEDVKLDLVNHRKVGGRTQVSSYFGRYAGIDDWRMRAGFVDGQPAVLVFDADEPAGRALYFVLLAWNGDLLGGIRDFRYARYVIDGARIVLL